MLLALRSPSRPLPATVELAAYRVVQEALTNAGRHAAGAVVRVRVDGYDGALVVEVATAGAVLPVRKAPGSDWSACGSGYAVTAVLPIAAVTAVLPIAAVAPLRPSWSSTTSGWSGTACA